MLSKVVPRGDHGVVRPFQFEEFGAAVAASAPVPKRAPVATQAVVDSGEVDALRAQTAELKAALEKQVAAAREAGIREGEARGRSQGEASVRPAIDRLSQSLRDVLELKPKLRKQAEEEAVQLALAIARRILRRELNVDASALQALVQVALERAGRMEIHRVIVHPAQATAIRETLASLTTRQLEIVPDGSRESGTLILETVRGAIDASLESQLKEIEFGLADRLKWR